MTEHDDNLGARLRMLYQILPAARRRQVVGTAGLMMAGALAEILSIGSLIPFLSALTRPDSLTSLPIAGPFLQRLAGDGSLVAWAASIFVILLLVSGSLRIWLVWASQRLAFDVGHDLSVIAFSKLINQPYDYYARTNSSELISRFEKVHILTYSSLLAVIQALVSSVTALLLLAFMTILSPLIALGAGTVLVTTYVLTSILVRKRLERNSRMIGAAWSARVETVQVALGGVRDILLDRSQSVFEDEFRVHVGRLRKGQSINAFISSAPKTVIETVAMIMVAVIAWRLAGQPGGLIAAIPMLGALALAAQRLLPLLQSSYLGWSSFLGNSSLVRDVANLIALPASPADAIKDFPPFSSELRCEHVYFAYPGQADVLHDVDFAIVRGERVGIVGSTGAGKSTLMDILLGLHRPSRGRVTVDGVEMDREHRRWWQAQIAHVPQHIFLSDDIIARNIAFGIPADQVDMARVRDAARMAGIADFIESLPDGYETMGGERGARLSGGQRQRLGIARALYKKATVLVLDEATSALDSETEKGVMAAIEGLSKDITIIMIAHRLDSLKRCGKILQLEGGRLTKVVESVDQLTAKS